MNRRSMLIPVAVAGRGGRREPGAAADGNGWSCISPFANYTNTTYPDDPPAPSHIIDSLAITVTRTDATPLTAVAGPAARAARPAAEARASPTRASTEQMYRRTGGIDGQLPRHPARRRRRTPRARSRSARTRPTTTSSTGPTTRAAQGQPTGVRLHDKVAFGGRRRSAPPTSRRTRRTSLRDADAVARAPLPLAHRQQPVPARRLGDDRRVEHGRGRPDAAGQGLLDDQHQGRDPGHAREPGQLHQRRGHRDRRRPSCSTCRARTGRRPAPARSSSRSRAPGSMGIIQVESKGYDRVGLQHAAEHPPVRQRLHPRADRVLRRQQRLHPGRDLGRQQPRSRPARPACCSATPTRSTADPALGDPATPGVVHQPERRAEGDRHRAGASASRSRRCRRSPSRAARRPRCRSPAPAPKPVTLGVDDDDEADHDGQRHAEADEPERERPPPYKLAAKTVSKYKVGKTQARS